VRWCVLCFFCGREKVPNGRSEHWSRINSYLAFSASTHPCVSLLKDIIETFLNNFSVFFIFLTQSGFEQTSETKIAVLSAPLPIRINASVRLVFNTVSTLHNNTLAFFENNIYL